MSTSHVPTQFAEQHMAEQEPKSDIIPSTTEGPAASQGPVSILPPAIQLQVWGFSLPRNEACLSIRRVFDTVIYTNYFCHYGEKRADALLALHPDHGSHTLALGNYAWAFGGISNNPMLFNWERDWLEVQSEFMRNLCPGEVAYNIASLADSAAVFADFEKVQNLVYYELPTSTGIVDTGAMPRWTLVSHLRWFHDLKQLCVIVHQGSKDFYSWSEDSWQTCMADLWGAIVNPSRVAQGKRALDAPTVKLVFVTAWEQFDHDHLMDPSFGAIQEST